MNKKCTRCNEVKSLDEFHWNSSRHKYRRAYCKSCGKKQNKGWRDNRKLDGYAVYYLPEEHYVGITSHIGDRMRLHRQQGKITDGYEIVGYWTRACEALVVEAELHCRGYNGCNYE
jgi:hypothetical protein